MELMELLLKISSAYDKKPWGKDGEGADPRVLKMLRRVPSW